MDIMELGAIGELVGGVAVIASLVYVGLQVRQGNRVARAHAQEEAARSSSQLLTALDREALHLLARAATDPDSIEGPDLLFLRSRFAAVANYFETLFYSFERGDLEPEIWESRQLRIAMFIAPVRDLCWEPMKSTFGARFRAFIDDDLLPRFPAAYSPVVFGGANPEGS